MDHKIESYDTNEQFEPIKIKEDTRNIKNSLQHIQEHLNNFFKKVQEDWCVLNRLNSSKALSIGEKHSRHAKTMVYNTKKLKQKWEDQELSS